MSTKNKTFGDGDNNYTIKGGGIEAHKQVHYNIDMGGGDDTVNVTWSKMTHDSSQIAGFNTRLGDGNDTIKFNLQHGSYATDLQLNIDSGSGDDTINVNNIQYAHHADDVDAVLEGGTGDDTITKSDKSNFDATIYGDENPDNHSAFDSSLSYNDTIHAGNGNNTIFGGFGDDNITAGDGNNIIYAGYSDNTSEAHTGSNTITVGDGDNSIYGGSGGDTITAGNGNDFIFGGDGNDTINAGGGDNVVTGGAGSDTFVFSDTCEPSSTEITDYDSGSDTLMFSSSDVNSMDDLTISYDQDHAYTAEDGSTAHGATTITDTDGNAVIIDGVTPDHLAASDFIFT
ncbi:calcium-binding protein [Flexibacterium corallicola]|uniref:calcium-binding protein n=1 Tax=Flexibacterium corallicola TaxID=3037259 RepID=UPI00286F8D2E|nr:calcium-binding protein [Pseudovibrio sp. M1P-2-3]